MTKIVHAATLALAVLTLASVAGCNLDPQDLIAKAQEYRQKGGYAAAIIELKNVLQKDPNHAEARYLLGVTYNDTGDFRSGEQELRRARELGYDQTKVILALGKSLLMTGEFQKVLDQVRLEGDASSAAQADLLTSRALASIGLGRTSDGRELLEQALAKQPEFADALLGQAQLAAGEKKLDEAGRLVERAIASTPNSLAAWLMKGDLRRLMGDQKGAEAAYQKVLERSPDNLRARENIVSLYIAGGNFAEARKQIEAMRKRVLNRPTTAYLQAMLEFRQKNYPAARDAVQQVLKVAPSHVPSLLLAGAVGVALGSHAQAQSHLVRVIERAPGNLYARILLISSLAQSGQVQRAIEALQPALEQAPEDGALMALAGEVYMQNNEFGTAAEYFERAAKRDPKSATIRTRLGMSRLASGETDRALADLESAVQLEPEKYQVDIALIMSYVKQGNYDQALTAMRSLEEKQPNNPLTYNLKAGIYIFKKDTASARKNLERALELQPTYVAAALNLAQLDLQEKNPQAARRRLEAILEKDKSNVQALLALADLGPRIGAAQKERIDWLERARKASPGSVAPELMLARLYAQAGDAKNALDAARRAQAIGPDNPQVIEMLGAAQIGAGEKEQAVATYGKLVALQPKSPGALVLLARAQAASANPAAASGALRKALALKPDFLDAQVMLAGLEVRAGNFPEAMKIARQVQKQAAKSPFGFVLEGDVLMAEKKFPQAAKAYETAYGVGKSGLLAVKLHAAYTRAGKPQEAEARLAQWLKESPDDAGVRMYAAEASLKSHKFKEAIEQYEWLRQKQPDNVLVLNNLAWVYHEVKDPRALETAERAYKLKPDSPAVADTLGWILVEQGNTKRGLELLQKAVTAAPKAPEIRYHLAQAWLKAGDKSKARDELERLLATHAGFPQQAEAEKLLEQLRK